MRLAALGILALALALRLAFVAATPDYVPRHDDRHYDRLACSILIAGVYPTRPAEVTPDSCGSMPAGENPPTAFRPPAYAGWLAGVHTVGDPLPFSRWTWARIVNALLGTLAVGLLGLIARHVWDRRVALVAMAVMALDLHLVLVGGSLMSEALFLPLVLGAVLAALKTRGLPAAALTGVLVGLATLTRPTALVLLLPLGIAIGWRPRNAKRVAVMLAATVLTVAPWTARNAVVVDAFIPVSDFVGSWVAGTYNDQSRNDPEHPGSSQTRVRGEFDDLRGMAEVPRQRELAKRGLEYARDNPGYVAEVLLNNSLRLLNLQGASWWRYQAWTMSLPRWAGDTAAVAFFLLLALAIAGAFTRAARAAPRWLWLCPAMLILAVIFAGSALRYRTPAEPFMALLAACALTARSGARCRPARERGDPRVERDQRR